MHRDIVYLQKSLFTRIYIYIYVYIYIYIYETYIYIYIYVEALYNFCTYIYIVNIIVSYILNPVGTGG